MQFVLVKYLDEYNKNVEGVCKEYSGKDHHLLIFEENTI